MKTTITRNLFAQRRHETELAKAGMGLIAGVFAGFTLFYYLWEFLP